MKSAKIFKKQTVTKIHLFPSGRFGNQMFLVASTYRLMELLESKQKKFRIFYHITNYADFNLSLALPLEINKYIVHRLYLVFFSNKSINNKFFKRLTYKIWKFFVMKKYKNTKKLKCNFDLSLKNYAIQDGQQDYFTVNKVLTGISQALSQKYDIKCIEKSISNLDVGLHFRFTDFLSIDSKASFGYLPDSYYLNAISLLKPHKEACIYIFTDDRDAALIRAKKLDLLNIRFAADFGSNHVEELIFFSRFNNLVISNSTYSWWAGYLAKPGSKVVAPWPLLPQQYDNAARSPLWLKVDAAYEKQPT